MSHKKFFAVIVVLLYAVSSFAQNNFEKNYQVEGTARKIGSKFVCYVYKGFDERCAVTYTITTNGGKVYSGIKTPISYRKGYLNTGFSSDRYFTVKIDQVTIFDDEGAIKDRAILSEGKDVSARRIFKPAGTISAILLFPISLASDIYVRNQLGVANFDYDHPFTNFRPDFEIGFKNSWLKHFDFEWGFSFKYGEYLPEGEAVHHEYGVNAGAFLKVLNNQNLPVFNPYIGVVGHYYFPDATVIKPTSPDIAPTVGFTLGWKYYKLDFRYAIPYQFSDSTFDYLNGYIQLGISIGFQYTPFSLFSTKQVINYDE